jgi:hypothetical protein
MTKFNDKITHLLNSQVPDFVLEDHPKFVEFLKAYFTFMESAELSFTSVQTTDGILLETETSQENLLLLNGSKVGSDKTLLDADDKIILESSTYGKFTNGETITGQTSGATATILSEDLSNNRIFINNENKFIIGETIVGSSSNASGVVNSFKLNPVANIQQLLDFRDPDKVIGNFLTKFRNEVLTTIPETLNTGVDKRKLIKNIKSLYRLKGTAEGHKIFFRLLFNEEAETSYPRENILRVSDGKWNTQKILRGISTVGDTNDLIGRTITGQSSSATAIVESVFKFQIGVDQVSEFILNEDTISGTFTVGEEIRGTSSDTSDTFIKCTITGLPNNPTISNDGNLYSIGDSVTITTGGEGALIQVGAVGTAGLTNFYIDDAGSNYEIGDSLVFTNTGTGGGSASAKVSVVNGGFTQETSTSTVDDHIILEDETIKGDPFEGNKFVQESGTGTGDITDIRIISPGYNFNSLPTVSVTSTSGTGAVIYAYGSEIGRIQQLKIIEAGKGFENSPTPPTLTLPTNLIAKDFVGTFSTGETITGLDSSSTSITAVISSVDSDRGLMKLTSATGTFDPNTTITGNTSSAYATVVISDQATASTTVVARLDATGTYINEDGHVSEITMKIQDSLLYQDFSYIIKVGQSINQWRDDFKKTMHTGGFYFTGQVNIVSRVDAQMRVFTGENSGTISTPIQDVLNTLFSTIFGRRLGTVDDGTTARATPQLGVAPDMNSDSTPDLFTNNTRDVTLTRNYKIIQQLKETTDIRSNTTKFGRAVAGPNLHTLSQLILNTHYASQISIERLNELKLGGTLNTSIDGEVNNLSDFGYKLKTSFALPSEIWQISSDSFDEDRDTFDETSITFDAV